MGGYYVGVRQTRPTPFCVNDVKLVNVIEETFGDEAEREGRP